jgi:hypothetical protein
MKLKFWERKPRRVIYTRYGMLPAVFTNSGQLKRALKRLAEDKARRLEDEGAHRTQETHSEGIVDISPLDAHLNCGYSNSTEQLTPRHSSKER